jgi:hypothetical protein
MVVNGMDVSRTTVRFGLMVLPLCLGVITGCDKDDTVQRYEVAKTSDLPVSNETTAPPTAPPVDQAAAPIHWTIPTDWKQLPGNEMRFASFAVDAGHPDLQVTVVPLSGNGGSLLSNINRWEGQIGLAPSSEDELKGLLSIITVAGAPVVIFDRTGPQPADHSPPKRILAAIFSHADRSWFFKLAGANDLVQNQKVAFDGFVRSVRFDGSPDTPADMTAAPTNIPAPATPADSTLPITYVLPQGWSQESAAQASPFRVVAFNVAFGTDTAEAVVTHVVKDSGTMLLNINRWRGQVGLDPLDDAGKMPSEKMTVHGLDATAWNFENTAADKRMLVAMITHGGEWWFFKLSGTSALVAGQKSNFDSFVTSIAFRGDKGE